MKTLLVLLIFCLVIPMAAPAQSKDDAEVAAAVETLKKAMLDANRQQLETITAPELSYGHSSGKIEDKAAFVEALTSGKSDFITMDLSEQTVKVAGNTALVRHHLTGNVSDNGKANTVNLGVLLVWQKQKGQWKLLARQAFKL